MAHLFFIILMALPLVAQAIVIDNGIPIGTEGHWSVDVLTGGATQSAVFTTKRFNSAELVTENVISSYRVFVDPGIDGQGFELIGSEPEGDIFDSTLIRSSGTFIGANGNTIRWFAASKVFSGFKYLTTTYTFDTAGSEVPIGPLRVYQYLDGDVQSSDDDILYVLDRPPTTFELRTLDNIELFGVSQYGRVRGNFSFAGSVADRFDQIQQRIVGPGQAVSIAGTINLPSFQHPELTNPFDPSIGLVHGPANVVSGLAWDVTPGARGAFVETFLEGRSGPPPRPPFEEGCFIEEEDDTCEGPIVPVRRQFSCQGTKCNVEIACNLATECMSKVELFVTPPPSTRLSDRVATEVPRRVKFASAVSNIPPGTTAIVKPKLTMRGKTIFRANRKKRIKGVMQITNAATGVVVTLVRVRIKLR